MLVTATMASASSNKELGNQASLIEYCPNNECEVMWWRLSGVDDHKYWVAPIYDPYEFVYVGMKDTPWENL